MISIIRVAIAVTVIAELPKMIEVNQGSIEVN